MSKLLTDVLYHIYHPKDDSYLYSDGDEVSLGNSKHRGTEYVQWRLEDADEDRYFIGKRSSDHVLDTNGKQGADVDSVYLHKKHGSNRQQWRVSPIKDSKKCKIFNEMFDLPLDGSHARNNQPVYLYEDNNDGYQEWEFLPIIEPWEIISTNIKYDEIPTREINEITKNYRTLDSITSQNISNNSDKAHMNETVKFSERIEEKFEWSLKESFKAGMKITMDAGIPLIFDGKMEADFEAEIGSSQTWTKTQEKTFEVSTTVDVPPKTTITVKGTISRIKGFKTNFALTMELKAKAKRLDNSLEYLTRDELVLELKRSGFKGEILDQGDDKHAVKIKSNGVLVCDYGIEVNHDIAF